MQQHIDQYRSTALCEALQVSRSGYHAWRNRPINADALRLSNAIAACHTSHKARAGAPYISADMQAQGFRVSEHSVGRIMQSLGLRAKGSRQFKRTTDSNHQYVASPHLLERRFTAGRPNQVWGGDITYIRTDETVKVFTAHLSC